MEYRGGGSPGEGRTMLPRHWVSSSVAAPGTAPVTLGREPAATDGAVAATVAGTTSAAELWRPADRPLSQLRSDWMKACEPSPGGPENPPGALPPNCCCAAPSVPPWLRLRSSDSTPVAPRMGPLRLRLRACWFENQRRGLRPLFGLRNGVHSSVGTPLRCFAAPCPRGAMHLENAWTAMSPKPAKRRASVNPVSTRGQ
jgi:hypothetical protein